MSRISRRALLAIGGAATLGTAVGGLGIVLREDDAPSSAPAAAQGPVDFASWRQTRRAPYYIGHRGAGDVAPEHTIPSYEAALGWSAEVLELSVVRSSDGELFCQHDLTLDRTTNLRGPASEHAARTLAAARVMVPRLGPRWMGANQPALPRLSEVLTLAAGRAVLCIEAKDDGAYPALAEAIESAGLGASVMLKVSGESGRLATAKAAGFPVFAYLGNAKAASADNIRAVARRLDPLSDALTLPARYKKGTAFSADLTRLAVSLGIPVWVAPVHRRSEVAYFSRLGVEGFVTPDLGYLNGTEPRRTVDAWASGAISAGELVRDPYSNAWALRWDEVGTIGLGFDGRPSFATFGQFCPIESDSYRLSFDAMFDPLPTDPWEHLSVAFGHADDRYYEHRLGKSDGYHVKLRADGSMEIDAHRKGDLEGKLLSPIRSSPRLEPGLWSRLTLDVTPETIRWSRDDGTSVEVVDGRFRGGYFHIGRSGDSGLLKLRNLSVT